jgi:hypothetical protein
MEKLPEVINASKVVTYHVENIVESILSMDSEKTKESITLDEVLNIIRVWVIEDFGDDWNIIYQDEDGVEL